MPALMVSTEFTAESYKIQLTDLANVWVESLDRKPIIKRGLVEDTSIDPTDGPDQLRRMIELIRAAFDINDTKHPNTTISIGSEKDDSLLVNVTYVLPKPLKPFKWPIHLTKCSHAAVATQIVMPLILGYEARAREIDQLVAALREKDGVITRLVDKLEATGLGLEHVFSALSGKRRFDRAIAESKVKGLAPFSEAEFRQGAREPRATDATTDIPSLLDGVFGGAGLSYKSDEDLEASSLLNDWWTKLGKGQTVVLVERPRETETGTPLTTQTARASSSDDDNDFQVQATPPGLSSARKRGTNARSDVVDDDSTSDGEDDIGVPEGLPHTTRGQPARLPGARLGALGGHRQPQRQPSPSSSRMTPPRQTSVNKKRTMSNAASETASDDDGDKLEDPPSPRSPPKPSHRRGGLGRIGGKRREVIDPVRSPSPMVAGKVDTPPKKHRLGVIGKQADVASSPPAIPGGSSRGRSKSPSGATKRESPRETSQERADRKRAELQRELEKKAAAGPAKKKRRF